MKYSLLEQHIDGSWWYHGHTFDRWYEAADFRRRWIWWDEKRNKRIIGHDDELPRETLYTCDFQKFYSIARGLVADIKTSQL